MSNTRSMSYVQWGRTSCTNGHQREYWGVVMASHYSQQKSQFICVDWERSFHDASSNSNHNGALLYTTEVEGGSSDETQYGHDREIACVMCTSVPMSQVYTRWGHRSCPSGTTKLYEGWIGGAHYGHNGSGHNCLCMHPQPQWAPGTHGGNQNGALIYGTEYENTGAVDKNHDKDAACSVCQRTNTASVYVQWGRISCTHGHRREYWG